MILVKIRNKVIMNFLECWTEKQGQDFRFMVTFPSWGASALLKTGHSVPVLGKTESQCRSGAAQGLAARFNWICFALSSFVLRHLLLSWRTLGFQRSAKSWRDSWKHAEVKLTGQQLGMCPSLCSCVWQYGAGTGYSASQYHQWSQQGPAGKLRHWWDLKPCPDQRKFLGLL